MVNYKERDCLIAITERFEYWFSFVPVIQAQPRIYHSILTTLVGGHRPWTVRLRKSRYSSEQTEPLPKIKISLTAIIIAKALGAYSDYHRRSPVAPTTTGGSSLAWE